MMAATYNPWALRFRFVPPNELRENRPPAYLPPEGTYAATIVGLIDVGRQVYYHDEKVLQRQQLVVLYELEKPRPDNGRLVLADRLNFSTRCDSDLASWLERVLGTRSMANSRIDLQDVLMTPVHLWITHQTDKQNVRHPRIKNIFPWAPERPYPTTQLEPVLWSVHQSEPLPRRAWYPRVYGSTVQNLVRSSLDFQGLHLPDRSETAEE